MTASILFLTGVGLTLAASVAIVMYLRAPLHNILAELCGTQERAVFWLAFCNVTIFLAPLIFAMQYVPELKPGTAAVIELATQLKWGLAGLLGAVVILGWVLSRFIRRQPITATKAAA